MGDCPFKEGDRVQVRGAVCPHVALARLDLRSWEEGVVRRIDEWKLGINIAFQIAGQSVSWWVDPKDVRLQAPLSPFDEKVRAYIDRELNNKEQQNGKVHS